MRVRELLVTSIATCAICVTWSSLAYALGQSRPAAATACRQASGGGSASIADVRKSVFDFWLQHGLDEQYGGFHGTLDRQGNPFNPTNKGIVQQVRHMWAMSALVASGKQPDSAAEARSYADNLYSFIKAHFRKVVPLNSKGGTGTGWVMEVTRHGNTVNDANIYVSSNAQSIYALAKYSEVTGSTEALNLALQTFKTLDALYHDDANGGYDESSISGPLAGELNVALPGTNRAGIPQKSQSLNTLMLTLEALTELSRVSNGSSPVLQARLLELVTLLTESMLVRPFGNVTFLALRYDPRGWKPVNSTYVDYGHNLQAAWQLGHAIDQLLATGRVGTTKASHLKAVAKNIGETAVHVGFDALYGGFQEGGTVTTAAPGNKTWWLQAEALNGLEWLYKQTTEQQYKIKLCNILDFVKKYFWDKEYGEWYWSIPREGGLPLQYKAGPPPTTVTYDAGVKGNVWKASYHTGRCVLALESKGY